MSNSKNSNLLYQYIHYNTILFIVIENKIFTSLRAYHSVFESLYSGVLHLFMICTINVSISYMHKVIIFHREKVGCASSHLK